MKQYDNTKIKQPTASKQTRNRQNKGGGKKTRRKRSYLFK